MSLERKMLDKRLLTGMHDTCELHMGDMPRPAPGGKQCATV